MPDTEPDRMITPDDHEILRATAEALAHTLGHVRKISEGISGDGLIRSYETVLIPEHGDPVSQVIYLETSPKREERDGVLVFRSETTDAEVSVWLYPNDPELPALAPAVFPDSAAVLLEKMGIAADELALSLVAYRPGKRAVVRMDTATATVYMKVVRSTQVHALHEQYRLWREAGLPVPATLGWSADGLIGFATLPGIPATDAVEALGGDFLDALEELVGEYGRISSPSAARTSLALRRDWYVRRLGEVQPDLADRARGLGERIGAALDRAPAVSASTDAASLGQRPTIHSDLHLGQVFVDPADPERITGILDIDTAGYGDVADDTGALIAHLIVSAEFELLRSGGESDERDGGDRTDPSTRAAHFERLANNILARQSSGTVGSPRKSTNSDGIAQGQEGRVQDARVRAMAAAHLLAHAIGAHVPATTLLTRAERVLEADENTLISPSFSSHL